MALFPLKSRCRLVLLLAAGLLALSWPAIAHDIPADSTVRMFIKPEGQRLHVLVRVQMASINDIDWPLRRPTGYLDLARVEPFLRDASTMWIADYMDVFEGGTKLAYPALTSVRLSPEGDTSFTTYDDALAHVTGPLIAEDTSLLASQGALDAFFEYTIQSDRSRFSIHPRFDRFGLRVLTILRFLSPDGFIRAFEYEGGDRGLIRLDPDWQQTVGTFGSMGFQHLVNAVDHLIFLLCLVVPFRRPREFVTIIGAFAAAFSITFIASAFGMAPGVSWFPPLIVTLVAVSILYAAVDNVIGPSASLGTGPSTPLGTGPSTPLGTGPSTPLGTGPLAGLRTTPSTALTDGATRAAAFGRRWITAFVFGLVHGFAFSFALGQTLQFAGSHVVTSVLAFDAGLIVGQLLVLAIVVPVITVLFRFVVTERLGTIVISALTAHVGWHWLTDRVSQLWKYQFTLPDFTPGFFADVLRWLMLVVAVAGVWWLASVLLKSVKGSTGSNGSKGSAFLNHES